MAINQERAEVAINEDLAAMSSEISFLQSRAHVLGSSSRGCTAAACPVQDEQRCPCGRTAATNLAALSGENTCTM